jgi:hypothetical protein
VDYQFNQSYMPYTYRGFGMRLLIYLLALVSGFSAAEAARAEVSPASSVAQMSVSAAEALASQELQVSTQPASHQPRHVAVLPAHAAPLAFVALTPVSRHDASRE